MTTTDNSTVANPPKENFFRKHKLLIITTVVMIFLWLLTPILIYQIIPDSNCTGNADKRGQFGDMYGMITSLFTGFTIIGLIYTIKIQLEDIGVSKSALSTQLRELELNRQELKLNRDEIALNRKEQELARKQFEMQTTTLKYQRFESTYFNLLNLHHELIRSVGGSRAILSFLNDYVSFHDKANIDQYKKQYNTARPGDSTTATKVHDSFGQVINNFEAIMDYIFDMKNEVESQQKYVVIFAAQMTSAEKALIFYHLNLRLDPKPEAYKKYKYWAFESLVYSNQISSEVFHKIVQSA